MSEDLLQILYVGTTLQLLGCERVAKRVRSDSAESRRPRIRLQYEPESLARQPLPAMVKKEGVAGFLLFRKIRAMCGCANQHRSATLQIGIQSLQGEAGVDGDAPRLATPAGYFESARRAV